MKNSPSPLFFRFYLSVFLLGAPSVSKALEGQLHGFCFSDNIVLDQVVAYLRPILLPDDQPRLLRPVNCFELSLSDPRKNLVETFLRKKYPIDRLYQGQGGQASGEMTDYSTTDVFQQCRLDITETSIGLPQGSGPGKKEVNHRMLLLGEKMPGHLTVDNQEIKISCTSSGEQYKTLTISMNGPEGEISTSLREALGKTVDLGQIVRNLRRGQNKVEVAADTPNSFSTDYQLVLK